MGGWALTCRAELGPPTCVIHGDAQPDNAGWGEAGLVFFDLDELASAWPVVDLVLAVRDVQPLDALSTSPTATGPGRALIAGYRSVGGVSAAELAMAPLLQRLAAAATYGSLLRALDHPALPDADPA